MSLVVVVANRSPLSLYLGLSSLKEIVGLAYARPENHEISSWLIPSTKLEPRMLNEYVFMASRYNNGYQYMIIDTK